MCWGSDDSGQIAVPPWQRFDAIAAGADHTCGLRVEGDAMCWGSDDDTTQVLSYEPYEAISAGRESNLRPSAGWRGIVLGTSA